MGTSTDADISWGIDLDEWENEDEDFDAYEFCMDGVILITHCSYECPMYILGFRVASARRGCPVELDPSERFKVGDDWQDKLDAACDALGVKREPGKLLLHSLWGR